MDRLLALYRAALRSQDRSLAAALVRVLRRDPLLRERADRDLQELPRLPPGPSADRERTLAAVLHRLRSYLR
jgi:hypothetical protein